MNAFWSTPPPPAPPPPPKFAFAIDELPGILVGGILIFALLTVASLYSSAYVMPRRAMLAGTLACWAHVRYAGAFKALTGLIDAPPDAFSAFTMIIGLVESILLGQTYAYYFERQGVIQDQAFREIGALARLVDLVLPLCSTATARRQALRLLHRYAHKLLHDGLSLRATLVTESSFSRAAAAAEAGRPLAPHSPSTAAAKPARPGPNSWSSLGKALSVVGDGEELHSVLRLLDSPPIEARPERPGAGSPPHVQAGLQYGLNVQVQAQRFGAGLAAVHAVVRDIDNARAVRVSQIHADLPSAQWVSLNLLGALLLTSFLLLDLKHQMLEATLFGGLVAASALFYEVVTDLSNPFDFEEAWSVKPAALAVAALEEKIQTIEGRLEQGEHVGERARRPPTAGPPTKSPRRGAPPLDESFALPPYVGAPAASPSLGVAGMSSGRLAETRSAASPQLRIANPPPPATTSPATAGGSPRLSAYQSAAPSAAGSPRGPGSPAADASSTPPPVTTPPHPTPTANQRASRGSHSQPRTPSSSSPAGPASPTASPVVTSFHAFSGASPAAPPARSGFEAGGVQADGHLHDSLHTSPLLRASPGGVSYGISWNREPRSPVRADEEADQAAAATRRRSETSSIVFG